MEKEAGTAFTGILGALCVAAVLLAVGCQSSERVAVSQACATCPLCQSQTHIQPLTGLKYTTCVCPSCKKVLNVDEGVVDALLRFTGPNVGESVTVCEACGAVVEECAVCRQARANKN
jgi:hypothetical protein